MMTEIDLERELGRLFYELRILANDGREYDAYVDGDTGQVLAVLGRGSNTPVKITPQQAVDAALTNVPGLMTKIGVEHEHWVAVYEVRILANNGREHEVIVDSDTGRVLQVKFDD
jgi:uncharacterized membrane protein YkoI